MSPKKGADDGSTGMTAKAAGDARKAAAEPVLRRYSQDYSMAWDDAVRDCGRALMRAGL